MCFASINGRATQEYVPAKQRVEILKHTHQFTNAVPSLELPDYTAHLSSFNQIASDDALDQRFNTLFTQPSGLGMPGIVNSAIQPPPPS